MHSRLKLHNFSFYGCFHQTQILVLRQTDRKTSKHTSGELHSIPCFWKSNYTVKPIIKPFKVKNKQTKKKPKPNTHNQTTKQKQTIELLISDSYTNNYQQHSLNIFLIDSKPTVTLMVSIVFPLQCQYWRPDQMKVSEFPEQACCFQIIEHYVHCCCTDNWYKSGISLFLPPTEN